jgi:hypothetical protein
MLDSNSETPAGFVPQSPHQSNAPQQIFVSFLVSTFFCYASQALRCLKVGFVRKLIILPNQPHTMLRVNSEHHPDPKVGEILKRLNRSKRFLFLLVIIFWPKSLAAQKSLSKEDTLVLWKS